MNRILYFKNTMMDSVPITNALSYTFFEDTTEDQASVTTLVENEALRWIIAHPFINTDFAREFFPTASRPDFHLNLVEPFTQPHLKPGDIDLLLINPTDPSKTIAFECKRVKIISTAEGPPKVNGAKQLAASVHQVNAYRKLGFHQIYLLIILLDDGRRHSAPNIMFHYATGRQVDEIFSIPWLADLHEDIGVIYLRINQMTGKHINHSHSIGYCIDKPAARRDQPFELTAQVQHILKRSNI
jgi:hypothetical protein